MTIKKVTWAELTCAVAIVVTLGLILMPALAAFDALALRESCANNLRQLGQSLRMFAEEDPGGFFPPMGIYSGNSVDCLFVGANGEHPPVFPHGPSIVASFNIETMYPDYVTDFTLFVCPADAGWTTNDLYNPISGEVDLMHDCDDSFANRGSALLELSYLYFGWYFDKTGDNPEWLVPAVDTWVGSHFYAFNAWPEGTLIPAQSCAFFFEVYNSQFANYDRPAHSRENLVITDSSIDVCGGDAAMPAGGWGNGEGSNELARLSTGLKRFLLTDVLNPAKGALVESEIFMMHDRVSVKPSQFNHIPDGGNVLYLDGHVEFVEYPGRAPVNPASAYIQSLLPDSPPNPRGIGPPPDAGDEGFGEGEFQTEGEGEDDAEIGPIEMRDVTPASGPVEGGNRVNLLGNFPAIATVSEAETALVVTFGDEVAAFDDVLSKEVSGGVLFVTAPAQSFVETEQVDVTVADAADGTNYSTLIAAYTYIVPDKGEQVGCGDLFTLLSQLETFMDEFGVSPSTLESGGLPAEASLYLMDGVLCTNGGSALEAATAQALESNLAAFDADDDTRFLAGFREVVATLMAVSTETQQNLRGVFEPMGIVLTNAYAVVECATPESCGAVSENGASLKTATEPYSGDGDIDNDGTSNRIEYDNIVGAGGGLNEFALVALDATTDGAPAEQEGSAEGSTEGEGEAANEGEGAAPLEEGESDGSLDGIIVCSPGGSPSTGGSNAWPDLALLLFCVFGLARWKRRLVLPRR